jgi:hypothetical protein
MDKYYYKFASDTDEFPADIKMNECPEGYTSFNDGEYVDWTIKKRVNGILQDIPKVEPEVYTPTLDELKQSKITEMKFQRDTLEQSGFTYLGKTFDSDQKSVTRITVAAATALGAIIAGQSITYTWTCADNTDATLTAQEFVGLANALASYANELHEHYRQLKQQINDCTTKEELEAITWINSQNSLSPS